MNFESAFATVATIAGGTLSVIGLVLAANLVSVLLLRKTEMGNGVGHVEEDQVEVRLTYQSDAELLEIIRLNPAVVNGSVLNRPEELRA